MENYAALKAELTADPLGMGYAQYIALGSDAQTAGLINAIGVDVSFAVSRGNVDRSTFIGDLGSLIFTLSEAAAGTAQPAAAKAAFWLNLYDRLVAPKETVNTESAIVIGFFASVMADGFMTQADITSLLNRQGSRAEMLWGAGTVIAAATISAVLRGETVA